MNTNADHSRSIPIQRSILSAEALAPIVAQAYELDGVSCQLIKSAMLDTYAITAATGPAILRIYPAQRRTKSHVLAELDVLDYLYAAGVAVSISIPQRDGDRLLAIQAPEGARYAALFTYAPGQPLSQQCTPPNARTFGYTLAQVHTIADTLTPLPARPPLDLSTLLDRSITTLDQVFGQRASEWAYLKQITSAVQSHIAALPTEPPWYGLCHGDVGSANAHITADGRLTLIDFDMCGVGWRAYDIATFCIDEPEAIVAAFLEGYQTVRALTATERAALPWFQIAQNIWVLGLRADYVNDWGSALLSDRLVNHILTFIKQTIARAGNR
jgi:Ser/Thr protein kinase RdoA (MazF antagonist)